jgi:diguanylate cyclase (GGDEF)-like protein
MDVDKITYDEENILVVDDEEAVREPLVEMLKHIGFHAHTVGSGEQALKELDGGNYTFLLTEMKMQEMDGFVLMTKAVEKFPELSVIAMTGYSKGYNYVDVINAGAADFINKPFGLEELEAKIRRAIIERNVRRELARLSITDALTGLYNQRHFYMRLREEITRSQRQKHPLALILLDMDDFKIYNDTYGHLAGDELLQKVGNIVMTSIRERVDSGYRYGGDEFAIILIDADETITRIIAKRIEKAIERECNVTASLGYAGFEKEMTLEELIGAADRNLYKFKDKKKVG